MNKIELSNKGSVDCFIPGLYFPRLQINKLGEIILATGKEGSLTTGILVGRTKSNQSGLPMGQKCDDWEVVGELEDYNGTVEISVSNLVKK